MKKLSFIRWRGLIPFIVITALVYVFTTYYMDHLLKKVVIKNATRLNGALVEIKSLNLSFLTSSLKIKGLEVANPRDLMQNRFEVGDITLDFQFLPLLKKKYVTDEISVTEVAWMTKRKNEGKIPESWIKEWERDKNRKDSEPAMFVSQAVQNLTNSIKSELPDISVDSLKERFDPRKAIKVKELPSYKKAFEVRNKAESSYSKWKSDADKTINDQKKFIDNTKKKLDSLNPKNLKTASPILNAINTLKSFESDIKKQKSIVSSKLKNVSQELSSYKEDIKSVPNLIKSDTKSIVDRYSFGSINVDNFSEQIFGMRWLPGFQKYVFYRNKLTSYYAKLSKKKRSEKKRLRHKGMNIAFPITDGTPKFLIKKVHLAAKTDEKEEVKEFYKGEYEIKINDISSNQKLYGKPTVAGFKFKSYDGPFKKADANLLIDYREDPKKDKLKIEVTDYKLTGYTLGEGSVFPLPLKSGLASGSLSGGTIGNNLNFDISMYFKKALYGFEKSSNYIVTLIQDIVKDIKSFKVNIGFSGTLDNPKFKITSTLDKAIANGIKKVFLKKIDEIRTKSEKYIREEVNKNLNAAKTRVSKLETNVKGRLGDQAEKIDFLGKNAKKRLDELKSKQKGAATDKLKGLFK